LLVVFLHLAPVGLALLRQLFGARSIAAGVGFLGLFEEGLALYLCWAHLWCAESDEGKLERDNWARIPGSNNRRA
jgi:hypothetical protein